MQKYPEETDQEDSRAALARSREREAASREILQVISASRTDPAPVFDLILKNAARLSGAPLANLCILNDARSHWNLVAHFGDGLRHLTVGRRASLQESALVPAVAIRTARVVHIEDLTETDLYKEGDPGRVAMVEEEGMRTILGVPLLIGDVAIGCITLFRREVKAFTEDEITMAETFAAQAVIAIENVRQFREVQTRLERERASAEILEVISQSRDNEQPVFETILENACVLCNAPLAGLILGTPEDHVQTLAAHRGMFRTAVELFETGQMRMDPQLSYAARSIVEGRLIAFDDMGHSELYEQGSPVVRSMVDDSGIRSVLFVPLVKDGAGIGNITLFRREISPFDPSEIALVETFAAQAVIAIDNVRQFRELQSRLEQETVSGQVLELISTSRDDDLPVFERIVQSVSRLCNAPLAYICVLDPVRRRVTIPAQIGARPSFAERLARFDEPVENDFLLAVKAMLEREVIRIADLADDDLYRSGNEYRVNMVDEEGMRSVLTVPLVSGEEGVGSIVLYRREVLPFSDAEVAVVRSFAAQAVIAIDNVRQFRELQERLRREAATRKILSVISQSRDDEQPVFDLIVSLAKALCNAHFSGLVLGQSGDEYTRLVAHDNLHPDIRQLWADKRYPLESGTSLVADAILDAQVQVIEDMGETKFHREGDDRYRIVVVDHSIRSNLLVPLISNGEGIGCLMLGRKEVSPYSDDEIALIQSFAAQAVIAIENVQQFREVQERLEREAATKEVLQVISQSRDNEQPVFEKILQNAARLCDVPDAALMLLTPSKTHFRIRAHWGRARIDLASASEWQIDDPLPIAQCFREARTVHIGDMRESAPYIAGDRTYLQMVDKEGLRTRLCVPLLKDGAAFGVIALSRYEVAPFNDGEIELVETFAAQAVIAIENVRQFKALEDSNADMRDVLERQTATARVLDVISQSPSDVQPVFDVIAETAMRLCDADAVVIWQIGPDGFELGAALPDTPDRLRMLKEHPATMDEGSVAGRAFATRATVHIDDISADPVLSQLSIAQKTQARTMLAVPLFSPQQEPVGLIGLPRREIRSFSPEEVALVETFADQASIAIENVRLFKALEKLNDELGDRVEEQVGEIERMGKLKRFLPAAVADTVVTSGSEDMLKSHRALLGVLFCDIRGFTAFCETAEPEETIEVLQTYHEEMGKLINVHGAGVDLRMGDGIMVLFNDPIPCDDPAGDAVRLAIAMRTRMAALCKSWKRLGHKLGFGVGISLGYATIGLVGSEGRFDYTASGTAVNLAARLCDEAEDGEILLSPRAGIAVEDDFTVQSRGEISLKGIREPLEVFILSGSAED